MKRGLLLLRKKGRALSYYSNTVSSGNCFSSGYGSVRSYAKNRKNKPEFAINKAPVVEKKQRPEDMQRNFAMKTRMDQYFDPSNPTKPPTPATAQEAALLGDQYAPKTAEPQKQPTKTKKTKEKKSKQVTAAQEQVEALQGEVVQQTEEKKPKVYLTEEERTADEKDWVIRRRFEERVLHEIQKDFDPDETWAADDIFNRYLRGAKRRPRITDTDEHPIWMNKIENGRPSMSVTKNLDRLTPLDGKEFWKRLRTFRIKSTNFKRSKRAYGPKYIKHEP
eukprot:TRINITY_DN12323_c0_g1_i1.p1 TRINITY_DN12323_c0_g1~~TRINITY_DN12323_c0_g1_i1.p1  ORF type:complete len:278 (+),score=69.84 TRINITY_DN12323_c0_g1_i1:35-868(+)